MKKILGIDIGGTKIFHSIVNENGEIIGEIIKEATPKTALEIENKLKDIITKYEDKVDIIGIATAGAVSCQNDRIISSTANMPVGYQDINFKNIFSKLKIVLENDANCACLAEHKIGAGKGYDNIIVLTLGTGVGGGIIINNKLLKGKNGAAGEMHFKMMREPVRKCTCGSSDCFEIYASGNGLRLTAAELSGNPDISTYDVIEGLKNGDESMSKIFAVWQNDIINGIIGLADIFDPDVVVLSGSMAQFTDTDFITEKVNSQIVTQPTKVVKATAGNYSGMIGAALLALEAYS